MGHRIFVAGASGVIGRRLLPLLLHAGHEVTAITRSESKAAALRGLGIDAQVVDVFAAPAVSRLIAAIRPDTIIHQLTDLPKDLDPALMKQAIVRNARIRDEGTRNLVRAAIAADTRRFIAQSIAWAYAPGPEPHAETDGLDVAAGADRGISVRGVIALENWTLNSPPLQGIVLRYGHLFGPGTPVNKPSNIDPLHVDAAAFAAFQAIELGSPGAFNIAMPNPHVATDKARIELQWSPDFRLDSAAAGEFTA